MAPARAAALALSLMALQPAVLAQYTSATTPASGAAGTLAFNAISVNPSAMVANSFAATSGATINGVATPLSGFNVLARTGWTDTNGAVMGQLLVRPPLGVFVPWRRAGADDTQGIFHALQTLLTALRAAPPPTRAAVLACRTTK
jgi:hypothetical protein